MCCSSTKSGSKHYIQSFNVSMSKAISLTYPILKIIIQLVRNSPTPIYFYKVKSHAKIAGNECAGNPFHDTTWLAFEETPRTHAITSGRLNPPT
eukprot:1116821-Pelagomonas_calceolata.AAC.1